MFDPPENLFATIDQSFYSSPGQVICRPSPTNDVTPLAHAQTVSSGDVTGEESVHEDLFDMAQALLEAEATGTRSAVVKEEIRHMIKNKRRNSGYTPTDDVFMDNKEDSDKLSAQDEERRRRRKASNRRAAVKCRERKKEADEKLKKTCNDLQSENKKLTNKVEDLQKQLSSLRKEMQDHKHICQMSCEGFSPPATSTRTTLDEDQMGQVSSMPSPPTSASTINTSDHINMSSSNVLPAPVFILPIEAVDGKKDLPISDGYSASVTNTGMLSPYYAILDPADRPADAFTEQEVPQYDSGSFELPTFNSEELHQILDL